MEAFLNDTLPQLLTTGGTLFLVEEIVGFVFSSILAIIVLVFFIKLSHDMFNDHRRTRRRHHHF